LRERRDDDRGAASVRGPRIRRHHIGSQPDGQNINRGCGSTAQSRWRRWWSTAVSAVAFDGDGDRAIFVVNRQSRRRCGHADVRDAHEG
jgi:phosphomannomutase